jgi:membrane associated rhomboid family serine protease
MRRPPATSTFAASFGPGPLTPAIKALIIANVVVFLVSWFVDVLALRLGFVPQQVLRQLYLWQPVTYMFLHGGTFHILFNMLALWMFGVELERMWGSRYFTKFYFVSGVGAAVVQTLLSFVPLAALQQVYYVQTIGASGAIYGVLLAYALYFPNRPIFLYFVFPVPAKYFVMIMGGIALLASTGGAGGGIAHTTHLGGMVAAYLYLKGYLKGGGRIRIVAEIKYRYLKWRINRMRRKFDVYSGGRADDVDRRVH